MILSIFRSQFCLILIFSIFFTLPTAFSSSIPFEVRHLVKQASGNQPYGTGFSLAVVEGGKLKFSTGGGNGVSVNGNSKFLLASVTKQLTAAAIVSLAQEGKLGFDDSITKFVPELLNWRSLRIKDLLNNSTSLIDFLSTPINRPHSGPTTDFQILSALHSFVSGVPSGCIQYSNTNFILLSLIVERASGMPFGDYLDRALFSPLEMYDTEYKGGVIPSDVETGHNQRNIPNMTPYYREWASGAGGVVSTAKDMAKWLIAVSNGFLNIKTIIPKESAIGACRGSSINKYGLGWQFDSTSELYHSGMVWGYASFVKINTNSGKGVVVLSNAEIVAGDKIKEFAERILSLSNNSEVRVQEETSFGSYCCTQFGKFGPHPTQRLPIGSACYWMVPGYGPAPGQVCQ
jgi:CubicO group peptidase (beta-lactamase class C family)